MIVMSLFGISAKLILIKNFLEFLLGIVKMYEVCFGILKYLTYFSVDLGMLQSYSGMLEEELS